MEKIRNMAEIDHDIETVSAVLKLLDKRMVDAKTPAEIEVYKKMILEHEKIFHDLEAEKLKAAEA